MTQLFVIGISGPQASGKTEVANIMEGFGASRIRMGDVIWAEADRRGLQINEGNIGKIANEIREKEGKEAVAKRCIPLIRKMAKDNKIVVIDGIRGAAEVEKFRDAFSEDFYLISVEAPEEVRFKRVESRKRGDDSFGWKAFWEKEERELGWSLKGAMEMADLKIVNDGTPEELYADVTEVFEKILGE